MFPFSLSASQLFLETRSISFEISPNDGAPLNRGLWVKQNHLLLRWIARAETHNRILAESLVSGLMAPDDCLFPSPQSVRSRPPASNSSVYSKLNIPAFCEINWYGEFNQSHSFPRITLGCTAGKKLAASLHDFLEREVQACRINILKSLSHDNVSIENVSFLCFCFGKALCSHVDILNTTYVSLEMADSLKTMQWRYGGVQKSCVSLCYQGDRVRALFRRFRETYCFSKSCVFCGCDHCCYVNGHSKRQCVFNWRHCCVNGAGSWTHTLQETASKFRNKNKVISWKGELISPLWKSSPDRCINDLMSSGRTTKEHFKWLSDRVTHEGKAMCLLKRYASSC